MRGGAISPQGEQKSSSRATRSRSTKGAQDLKSDGARLAPLTSTVEQPWYSVREAARLLRLSHETVYALIARCEIEAVHFPGLKRPPLRISATALRAYTDRAERTRPILPPIAD